ncbi:2OG-Fe(II) oxygenase [Sphingobium sp.]|uniref:2OG-Fe(II) oxygenase n=1 Tax=Sphingobium sp. TaxID=1912891 RepID=UPI0035C787B0
MNNVWEVWPSALTGAECDAIIKRADLCEQQSATVGFAQGQRSDHGYRSSTISWLDVYRDKDIVDRLMQFVHSSNRTNFGIDIAGPYELQFTEYHGRAQGKYDWHQDIWLESSRPFDRKLSVVVQLSDPDDYEGGQFEFFGLQQPGANFAPRGSMLIFPSFLQHRVLPVTKGIRRSLVSWIEGPRWR